MSERRWRVNRGGRWRWGDGNDEQHMSCTREQMGGLSAPGPQVVRAFSPSAIVRLSSARGSMGWWHTWTGNKLPRVRPLSCPSSSSLKTSTFMTPWACWERNVMIHYTINYHDVKGQKKRNNSCISIKSVEFCINYYYHGCFVPFLPCVGSILFLVNNSHWICVIFTPHIGLVVFFTLL